MTPEQTFYFHEVEKYYVFFDVPHLLKSLRNNLLTGDFILDDERISLKDIKQCYAIDRKAMGARTLLKITPTHLEPNPFQKLSVKLAAQLLSGTVARTMKAAMGELNSTTALSTANFITKIDQLFDALIVALSLTTIHTVALCLKKTLEVKETLEQGLNVYQNII